MRKFDKPVVFVSLDLETSGTDHDLHVPIQIGLAVGLYEQDTKDAFIGGWDWTRYEWDAEAEKVHNIPRDFIDGQPSAGLVDGLMAHWLWEKLPEHARTRRAFVVPLGWNVGSFDLPFVRKHMPLLSGLLGYRALDLNSVCFFLGGAERWSNWKMWAKERGFDYLNTVVPYAPIPLDELAHDAGFDAQHALASFYWLQGEARVDPC